MPPVDQPPIYAETPPSRPAGRLVAAFVALFVLPAALGGWVGALLRPLWEIVARVEPWHEIVALLVLAIPVLPWLLANRRRLVLWRAAVGRALFFLALGFVAWSVLALAGQSPVALGERSWLLAAAALYLVALGEAAGLMAGAAPFGPPLASLRGVSRVAGVCGGIALGVGLWLGPPGAWLAGAGLVLLVALGASAAWRLRPVRAQLRARCPRCGVHNNFRAGTDACTACGLVVRWDGSGPLASNAGYASTAR